MTASLDREVAGLRCKQVLQRLSDYLDGSLSAEERAQIEAHVRGCKWCDDFGGAMGRVVGSVRRHLERADELDASMAGRLNQRLGLADSSGR